MISEDNSNINRCNSKDKFANFLPDFEKSLSNAKDDDLWYDGNGPEADQKTTLPNSVRLHHHPYFQKKMKRGMTLENT